MAPVTRRSKRAEVSEEDVESLNSQGGTDQESVESQADIEGEDPEGFSKEVLDDPNDVPYWT